MVKMGEKDGADKGAPSKGGRYRWSAVWHDDFWAGIVDLNAEELGVYWRIILLMNMKKAALADDDRWLARQCNEPLRSYRRIKASLIRKGRIEIDEENGLVFDGRAVSELVKAGRYSEKQAERASKKGKPAKRARQHSLPLLRVMEGGAAAGANSKEVAKFSAKSCYKIDETSGDFLGNKGSFRENSAATHTHTQKDTSSRSAPPADATAKRAAQPLERGGAQTAKVEGEKLDARARRQKAMDALSTLKRAAKS